MKSLLIIKIPAGNYNILDSLKGYNDFQLDTFEIIIIESNKVDDITIDVIWCPK